MWSKKGMESWKSPREGVLGPEPGTPGTLPPFILGKMEDAWELS